MSFLYHVVGQQLRIVFPPVIVVGGLERVRGDMSVSRPILLTFKTDRKI
jgi:hypothetical protein